MQVPQAPRERIGTPIPRCDPDRTQLMQDTWDVFVGKTKSISDFPDPKYQERILAAYRFLSVAFQDPYTIRCQMSRETMDLV